MMFLAACVIALVLLSGLVFYALRRKNRVRAVFKGPLSAFSFEFEADDVDRDSSNEKYHTKPTTPETSGRRVAGP